MSRSTVAPLAPHSIDLVRVVRRCMRCFTFGAIGLLPVVGVGLAVQALRWGRVVNAEVGGGWSARGVYCLWLIGLVAIGVVDRAWGFVADVAVCVLTLGAQSYHLWRSFEEGKALVTAPSPALRAPSPVGRERAGGEGVSPTAAPCPLVWNPAERQLFWGVAFAYAGLGMSLWLLGVLFCRLTSAQGLV